jgi:Leucine-rich repeat (LRR) protein
MGLHFNQFTGCIPWEQLCNIMPLLSFHLLNSNKFNRPILTAISNCTQLQILFLADNKLSCPLPHQLGKLKKFQNLFAGNKQLTDPLPKELDNLPISNQMDISHNNITGLIPSNYGRNVDPDLDISIVDFSNNMLTGIF